LNRKKVIVISDMDDHALAS
jgi:hypothetical protein